MFYTVALFCIIYKQNLLRFYACVGIIVCSDQVSERSLPPPPPQQQSLHERVLAEIKQERKLRPVVRPSSRRKGSPPPTAAHVHAYGLTSPD